MTLILVLVQHCHYQVLLHALNDSKQYFQLPQMIRDLHLIIFKQLNDVSMSHFLE